jgi:hypothetical protein
MTESTDLGVEKNPPMECSNIPTAWGSNMTNEKPLFIPLRTEWFEQFERGEKDTEYRLYGKRWNERTCRIGRTATLSHGYGKARRMTKRVVGFRKLARSEAPEAAKQIFPDAAFIAAIELR